MATTAPVIVPRSICDALALPTSSSRDDVVGEAKVLLDTAADERSEGDRARLAALIKALALPSLWTRQQVLAAIDAKIPKPIEAQNALSQVAVSIGLAADAPRTAILAKTRELTAKSQVEKAIGERRLHRTQRKTMLDLAARDFALFETGMATFTEPIGYPTAEGELNALVDARIGTGKSALTFAAALNEATRDHPELAAEVYDERNRAEGRREDRRHSAGEALAVLVTRSMSEGKTFDEALKFAAEQQPELVIAHTTGARPK